MAEEWIRAVNGSDENTSTTISPFTVRKVELMGYPGPLFGGFLISGLASLAITNVVSISLIIYLCGCTCRSKPSKEKTIKEHRGSEKQKIVGTSGDSDRHTKGGISSVSSSGAVLRKGKPAPSNRRHIRNFWKWIVSERFVLYIASYDVGFAIAHTVDYSYIYHYVDFPPYLLCAFLGFAMHQCMVGQWFVVTTSAVSACSLVVFGKRISLGRWDWRLFAFAFVFPLIVGICGMIFGFFGPIFDWCFINVKTELGLRYNTVQTVFQIVVFVVVAIAYAAIMVKIRRTAGLLEGSSTTRYQGSERMMLIFVAVFIFQWSTYVMFDFWVLINGKPDPVFIAVGDVLTNLGGVYNCFAYTIIRRRLQQQTKKSGANAVASDFGKSKRNALDGAPTTAVISVTVEDTTTGMSSTTTGTEEMSKQHQTMRF